MQRRARIACLVELCARGLDLFLRELAIALEEGRELPRRLAHRLEAERGEALAEFRRLHDLRRLGGELRHELARRAGGRCEREVERGVEVTQSRLRECRHVGNERMPMTRGGGEALHLARLEVRRGAAD